MKCFPETDHPDYVQVRFSLRAHAYAVNGSYLFKLRDHFLSTYESMKDDLFLLNLYQKRSTESGSICRFAIADMRKKMIAEQTSSFSDIEKADKKQG